MGEIYFSDTTNNIRGVMIFNQTNGLAIQVSQQDISRLCDKYFPKRNEDGTPSYFPGQKEAIVKTCTALQNKKAVVIDAPVGSGKSAINYTVGKIIGTTVYITSQKALQTQIDNERFAGTEALKGRCEYNCPPVSRRVGYSASADSREFHSGKNCRDEDHIDPTPSSIRTDKIIKDIVSNSACDLDERRAYLSGLKIEKSEREVKDMICKHYEKYKEGDGKDEYDTFVVKNYGCVMAGETCSCPYKVAKSNLLMAGVRVMNPDNFYYQQLATPEFANDVDIIVFDEAHCLDDAINRVMSQVVPITMMKTLVGLDWSDLVTDSPIKFRDNWSQHFNELSCLHSSARVLDNCRPITVSRFSGGPINASDPNKQQACELFDTAMRALSYTSVLDVIADSAHMLRHEFEEWREFCSKTFVSASCDENGDTVIKPPSWLTDFDANVNKKVFQHLKGSKGEIPEDYVLSVLDRVAVDRSKYFAAVDKLVTTTRSSEKNLPVFVPVKHVGESYYERGLELANGYSCKHETHMELVCVDIGAVLNRFFYGDKKLVFSSGSWIQPDKDMKMLGLSKDDIEVVRVPSTFEPKSRPIYNTAIISFSEKDEAESEYVYKTDRGRRAWISHLNNVVASMWKCRPGVNIVIHSNSFALSTMIAEYADISDNWLFHFSDQRTSVYNRSAQKHAVVIKKDDGVQRLKDEPNTGLVLISPSVKEGVDFKYGAARAQIVVKAPVPYMGDTYIKSAAYGVKELEIEGDRDFITRRCIRDFMQMYGRVMRSPDDGGITFVLDQKMIQAVTDAVRNKNMNTEYIKTGLMADEVKLHGATMLQWKRWPYLSA